VPRARAAVPAAAPRPQRRVGLQGAVRDRHSPGAQPAARRSGPRRRRAPATVRRRDPRRAPPHRRDQRARAGAPCGADRLTRLAVSIALAFVALLRFGVVALAQPEGFVDRLYAVAGRPTLWVEHGRVDARARAAIAALADAPTHGLDAADYGAAQLAADAHRLEATRGAPTADLARFDRELSGAILRLLADLHLGRIDPATLDVDYDQTAKRDELVALVDQLARGTPVATVVDAAEPPLLEHVLLEHQLARHRALAADPRITPVHITPKVRPGDHLPEAASLARWLAALGDLAPDTKTSATKYEGALVEAVERFQARHGLPADGVIGDGTARALAVPVAKRLHQIELALERVRWLPPLGRDRAVIVNVPSYEVLGFDAIGTGAPPALRMSVVVGRAFDTETPFFARSMTRIAFAPYWNVPTSIVRNELLPKIRANPGYIAADQLEIVRDGRVVPPTADAIALLGRGGAELRQRPGPRNALGRVKFLFPNRYGVYMHDTPAHTLFGRARRDYSHGCIRLADAATMARWVLGGDGMAPERIDALLAATRETVVAVQHPIPVVITYATAVADPDGTIAFYDDVYGHDAELDAALGARSYRR
jgi:murein L,D-transpeptidase YcbB/YkuD